MSNIMLDKYQACLKIKFLRRFFKDIAIIFNKIYLFISIPMNDNSFCLKYIIVYEVIKKYIILKFLEISKFYLNLFCIKYWYNMI